MQQEGYNQSEEEKKIKEYYLLLFQSEFHNLLSTKNLSSELIFQLIEQCGQSKLKNNEYMDLYLCENLFSTLLPGLESLSKTIEKLIKYSKNEDDREVIRFNPCNYLGEFLMRNNPKYGKNQETHEIFLRFCRKERKTRMTHNNLNNIKNKVEKFYEKTKSIITKRSIVSFVQKLDAALGLNNTLVRYDWVEHFRINKDDSRISIQQFFEAFVTAILELHQIEEVTLKVLLD